MRVVVNGKKRDIKSSTILELLNELNLSNKVMAVAINMEVIKKDEWKDFLIKESDKIELVQFVGGG